MHVIAWLHAAFLNMEWYTVLKEVDLYLYLFTHLVLRALMVIRTLWVTMNTVLSAQPGTHLSTPNRIWGQMHFTCAVKSLIAVEKLGEISHPQKINCAAMWTGSIWSDVQPSNQYLKTGTAWRDKQKRQMRTNKRDWQRGCVAGNRSRKSLFWVLDHNTK